MVKDTGIKIEVIPAVNVPIAINVSLVRSEAQLIKNHGNTQIHHAIVP